MNNIVFRNKTPNPVPNVPEEESDLTVEQNDNMPCYARIPNLTFDVDKLYADLKKYFLDYPIYWAGGPTDKRPMRKYGGWSITSSNGDPRDGWASVKGWTPNGFDFNLAVKNGFVPRWYHTKRTFLCNGYFNEVLDKLEELKLYPHSARIWYVPPGGHHIGPHTDGADNSYHVRLHIPITSNNGCVHEWYANPHDVSIHMPADGSCFLFRNNIFHDTYNHGTTDRYHLIVEVYDTLGLVKEFKYDHISKIIEKNEKMKHLFFK